MKPGKAWANKGGKGENGYSKSFRRFKAKMMKERLTKALISKLEDEIDASKGIASLADVEGTLPLEIYIESRKSKPATRNK